MLKISKKELEELYNNNTNDYVCEKLNITKVTLLKYVKLAGIEPKGKGGGMGGNKIEVVG